MALTIVGILISFNIALLFIVMIVEVDIYCFFAIHQEMISFNQPINLFHLLFLQFFRQRWWNKFVWNKIEKITFPDID